MSEEKPKYRFRYTLKVRTIGEREGMDSSIEWAEAATIAQFETAMKEGAERIAQHFAWIEADEKAEAMSKDKSESR